MEAYDGRGRSLTANEANSSSTAPMPSMPVQFWNDPQGERYRQTYFDYPGFPPNIWRHGDWVEITSRDSVILSGRSDATLNRGGIRTGTAEIYSVVEAIPHVDDSLVVHDETAVDGAGEIVLFVVPAAGVELDEGLRDGIRSALRRELSPHYVPDAIEGVAEIPRTMSQKKWSCRSSACSRVSRHTQWHRRGRWPIRRAFLLSPNSPAREGADSLADPAGGTSRT